jgi:hypothetical protein
VTDPGTVAAQVPASQQPPAPPALSLPPPEPAAPPPVVAPPAEPQGTGVSNQVPQLPANPMGGAARAAAIFDRLYTIASGNANADPASMAAALTRIQAICEAAVGDVGRFAPDSMRSAAYGEADAMLRGI